MFPSCAEEPPRLLFQDAHLAIVEKPSGIVVHPGWAQDEGGVVAWVRTQAGCEMAAPLHRLDRGTSGLVGFALRTDAARFWGEAFANSAVEKHYVALVRGHPPERLHIDHPVPKTEGGERVPAQTDIGCIGTWDRYALVWARPVTGRFHQIRRHLKHISCPILGDVNYGKGAHNRFFRDNFGLHRLALHAVALRLPHIPGQEKDLSFTALPRLSLRATLEQTELWEPLQTWLRSMS